MNRKILVVDDEYHITRCLTHLLRQAGYDCLWANDGQEALRQLRSEHPAVVLLDLDLPRMNGLEVLRALRADPSLDDVCVFLITALSPKSSSAQDALSRVREVLLKPYDPKEIVVKVAEVFQQQP